MRGDFQRVKSSFNLITSVLLPASRLEQFAAQHQAVADARSRTLMEVILREPCYAAAGIAS